MARADDEDQFRRANVEPQDVTGGAKRDDQFAKCGAHTDLAVAVGRDRQMTLGSSAKSLDRLVGTQGVVHRPGPIQQEVEQAISIGCRLGRELDLERHFAQLLNPRRDSRLELFQNHVRRIGNPAARVRR